MNVLFAVNYLAEEVSQIIVRSHSPITPPTFPVLNEILYRQYITVRCLKKIKFIAATAALDRNIDHGTYRQRVRGASLRESEVFTEGN